MPCLKIHPRRAGKFLTVVGDVFREKEVYTLCSLSKVMGKLVKEETIADFAWNTPGITGEV